MSDLVSLLDEATVIGSPIVGEKGYAIVYGSQITGTGSPDSDLDLLYVLERDLGVNEKRRIAAAVLDLHRRNGLRIDNEVTHDVKLTAAPLEVAAAITLRAFTSDDGHRLHVPAVDTSASFLNSPTFKYRLILGALTGDHLFLCGNLASYRHDRDRATRSLAVLSSAMLAERTSFRINDLRDALLTHPSGASGKDHLGYTPGPAVEQLARIITAELQRLGVVVASDHQKFLHKRPLTGAAFLRPAVISAINAQLR